MFSIVALILCMTTNDVKSFDYNEYSSAIETLSMNPLFVSEFEKHIAKLKKIEPNYYNYTPFASIDYKFDCSPVHNSINLEEETTSVHRLRPQDIKVGGSLT